MDRVERINAQLVQTGGDSGEWEGLRAQIEAHQKHDSAQSYLERAIGYVWGKDE